MVKKQQQQHQQQKQILRISIILMARTTNKKVQPRDFQVEDFIFGKTLSIHENFKGNGYPIMTTTLQ